MLAKAIASNAASRPAVSDASGRVRRSPLASTRAAFHPVFHGVMVAMFLAAIDQTILAAPLPAIGASLGGFA
jgi:hypothetical protein